MTANHYDWSWGGPLPRLLRHSEVKHSLLRDYLVEYFLTLVASPHQDRIQITIVDGFCGGGRYVNEEGAIAPGSPVVILQAIEEAKVRVLHEQQRRKPIDFDVQLICIDEDPGAIEHLRHVLAVEGYGERLKAGTVTLLTGAFEQHAAAAVAVAQRRSPRAGRAIFVLDQYGYDAVPVQTLQRIFASLKTAEVILTFNVDSLINFLCEKNALDFERKVGLKGVMSADELDAQTRGPAWRLQLQSKLYKGLTDGSGASWFTPFFIRPERGHGDFWLLHLSQHWKARDVMAGSHWKHHNHFVHYGTAGFNMFSTGYAARIDNDDRPQAGFLFDDIAATASQKAMLAQIPKALETSRDGIAFERFFLDRINTTPATREMVEATILELVRERQVEVVGDDGSLRNVRKALKGSHILKLAPQRTFVFGSR
ncbi:MAG: three-Cys-motif partner protein TcmP [Burkholderiaceae bacterium]